ncbi:terminase large subunit domain-containing protein [Paracoccus sp. KR1-242]
MENLKIPEGKLAGSQVKLAKYQKQFLNGALKPEIMVACLSIGRGNGKTALSAGVALAEVMGVLHDAPQPKREVLLVARNRDQGKVAFQFILGFIEGLPDEDRALFDIRRGQRLEAEYSGNGGGIVRVIPADGKSILGGAPTMAILDERAAWHPEKGQELENAILSGLGKRDGRAFIISTSAPDDANAFSRWLDQPPPGTYVQEHRPQEGCAPDDVEALKIANPGAAEGIGSTLDWLKSQAARAIARGGSALASFRNLNLNQRVNVETGKVLVTVDEWLSAEVAELPGRDGPCVLGVDLGGSRSMSAAALYWPLTGRAEVWGAFPTNPGLADRGAADGVGRRYVEMEERGELWTQGDLIVPPADWLRRVIGRAEGYPIACIVGDRFREAEFREAMQAAGVRVPFVARGNGFRDGGEDVERFRSGLFDGRVKTLPSLLLRSAMAEAIVVIDDSGNEKLTKKRSLGRIDAASALVVAVAEGQRRAAVPERGPARVVWA